MHFEGNEGDDAYCPVLDASLKHLKTKVTRFDKINTR